MSITLPTVDYMEGRLLQLGRGAYLYKTDLARGYRQLRVDPADWPLLGFTHEGKYYFDLCPPFGLRTSALCMQRTSEAISWIHGKRGFLSRPYLDDFGGAEATKQRAQRALQELQNIMGELGVKEAKHKVCQPATRMVWLGLWYDSTDMTISIPKEKLFFLDLLPDYNGIRIVDKTNIPCQDKLELDACLSGCGAYTGDSYYAEKFPDSIITQGHTIAHLELLNIVVAMKMWGGVVEEDIEWKSNATI